MSTDVVAAPSAPSATQEAAVRPWWDWWRVALGPAVAAVVAGSILPAGRHLWQDEYVTAYASRLTWPQLGHLLQHIDIVHGLYYVFMHLWVQIFGASTLALRAPSIIAMGVAAGALAVLGRRLVDTTTGVLAGLLLAVVPSVSRYAQEARSYAWVSVLVLLTTLGLTSALRDPRTRRWVLYGTGLVALTYLHFVALLVVPAHALLVWRLKGGGRRALRPWALAVLIPAALAAPMAFLAKGQDAQVAWIGRDSQKVSDFPTTLFGDHAVAWTMMIAGAYGAVALWQAYREVVPALLAWALVPPVVTWAVFPVIHVFLAKYVLFTLPAWALLVAAAVVVPLRRPGPRLVRYRWFAMPAALLAVLALGWGVQERIRSAESLGEPDFRGAAAFMRTQAQPGDGIVYSAPSGNADGRVPILVEMGPAVPREVFQQVSGAQAGTYTGIACPDPAACLGDTQRMWAVAIDAPAGDPLHDFPQARKRLLTGEFSIAGTERFRRLQVVLLLRHPAEGT
ncbi:glycosyltransferase family 39 protein [Dactylosporangium sp. CA-233914]|uniref:glycosyltransferase family 39 protein n=1 Tax=Dactylosporangium sp. CA-233914 TaxID=3239934 RepID=UPI003D8FE714